MLLINEVFHTIQGEGYWTGRPAVFVRFSRCNLWTGREEDRATAICTFCDTDFLHVDKYELDELVDEVMALAGDTRFVVLTGGEPSLQVRKPLIDRLHEHGFYVAIETNGTMPLTWGIDWVCVSPKAGTRLVREHGDELKLVYPQQGIDPAQYEHLDFEYFWLSPMDGPNLQKNTAAAIEYCLAHPRWRLNIQTHKVVGVR